MNYQLFIEAEIRELEQRLKSVQHEKISVYREAPWSWLKGIQCEEDNIRRLIDDLCDLVHENTRKGGGAA